MVFWWTIIFWRTFMKYYDYVWLIPLSLILFTVSSVHNMAWSKPFLDSLAKQIIQIIIIWIAFFLKILGSAIKTNYRNDGISILMNDKSVFLTLIEFTLKAQFLSMLKQSWLTTSSLQYPVIDIVLSVFHPWLKLLYTQGR